jgi:hypothetical protein
MASKPKLVEWGSFSIRQDGITVARGTGPLASIRVEATHYAMMYGMDGPVRVTVRRLKPRAVLEQDARDD